MFLEIGVEFKINIATIMSLIIGIFVGLIIFILLYVISAVKSLDRKVNYKVEDVDYKEVEADIEYAQEKLKVKAKENKEITFELLRESVWDLIKTIAQKFYPDSKKPVGELTIDELILLDKYIIDKMDELLSHRGLRFIKGIKANTFLNIINMKQAYDNNKVVKAAKKYKLKWITKALGILNPATWVRVLAINPSIGMITRKLATVSLKVIGQETYNVYSKKAFIDPVEDAEIKKLLLESENEEEE